MKKAMITIEVLISLMILMIVIASSVSAIKFFRMAGDKKQNYEEIYVTVLSIKDKLSPVVCKSSMRVEGEINGYIYTAQCEELYSLREYEKASEPDDPYGNIGSNIIQLYRVSLSLQKEKLQKRYAYVVYNAKKSPR